MTNYLRKFLRQNAALSFIMSRKLNIDSDQVKHLPFLFWLIEKSQPKIIVQLGANDAIPYYGYCYAINELNLKSHIFVIDLLNSEQQTYSSNVYYGDVLPNFFLNEFKLFSTLLHRTFEDAVHHFNHNSIDLLHISSAFSSRHIKNIMATWKEKLSDRSLILIDNFNNLDQTYNGENIWDELKNIYPSFSFSHAKGLCLISTGNHYPESLKYLFEKKNETALSYKINAFYENLGLQLQTNIAKNELLQQKNHRIIIALNEIELMKNSISWRITKPLRHISHRYPSIMAFTRKIKHSLNQKLAYLKWNNKKNNHKKNESTHIYPALSSLNHYKSSAKIAVVLHIFYVDIWEELYIALANINEPFDLFISLIKDNSEQLMESIKLTYPNAFIHVFPNHGRDVLPFMLYINTGVFNQYDAVLKLHTKKSLHMKYGKLWRSRTYHSLAGSKETIKKIIQSMRKDKNIGLVGAPNSICDKRYWADSEKQTIALAKRIHCHVDIDSLQFISATMFWINPFILHRLQLLNLSISDFEIELGQLKKTTAHHIERLIGVLCNESGMKILETSEILNI